MSRTKANGIEIEYDTFGDPGNPALLLVMGLGGQLTAWDERLCGLLAERGLHVIRYDNRDVGLSTKFDAAGQPDLLAAMSAATGGQPLAAPYTVEDMADDGIGLLDALGIDAAHIVGVSMGGMIVQAMVIRHPARVLSLCSIMSTTGDPTVGMPSPEAMTALMQAPPTNRAEAIESAVRSGRIIGSPGYPFDEERVRDRAGRDYDRSWYPDGTARQLVAIVASPDRTAGLHEVKVPTLVIHGDADPLVTPSGGEATARAVPGAQLIVIPGMGHDLPIGAWPTVVDAIAANAARVVPA